MLEDHELDRLLRAELDASTAHRIAHTKYRAGKQTELEKQKLQAAEDRFVIARAATIRYCLQR